MIGVVEAQPRRASLTHRAGFGSAASLRSFRGIRQRPGKPEGPPPYRGAVCSPTIVRPCSASRGAGGCLAQPEEIELVFDRNKSAIYALYSRALREQPELQGKVVVQLTIAPSGAVTDCRVISTELNDSELERKLVARIRMFRFEEKDVEAMTTTKPIEFFPA